MTAEGGAIHRGNQFKKILKHGFWYFLSSLSTKAVQFFLLPVYTRYLSPSEYGVLNSLYSVFNLLPIFVSLYLDSAFGRYYYLDRTVSREKVRDLYSTHFWFVTGWGIVVVFGSWLLTPYTLQPLLDVPFYPYIPLITVPVLFSQLAAMGLIYLKAELKAREITILNLVAMFLSTVLVLVMLMRLNMGIIANLCGVALTAVVNFAYFVYVARKNDMLRFRFKGDVLKRSLLYALPLIPGVSAVWVSGLSDRLVLAFYGRISEVGIYSITAQIALVMYMVNDAMTQVQGPISMSSLTENMEQGKKQISEFLSFYVWVVMFFYLCLTFFFRGTALCFHRSTVSFGLPAGGGPVIYLCSFRDLPGLFRRPSNSRKNVGIIGCSLPLGRYEPGFKFHLYSLLWTIRRGLVFDVQHGGLHLVGLFLGPKVRPRSLEPPSPFARLGNIRRPASGSTSSRVG